MAAAEPGIAPMLEEDVATSSISQDEIGHALLWYTILHEQLGQPQPDRLAFWRVAHEFRNATLVELPKGDSPAKMSHDEIKAAYLALPAGQARIAFFNAHKAALISL